MNQPQQMSPWRAKFHEIIFEADTAAGKAFDVALLIAIFISVLVVVLDSVDSIHEQHPRMLMFAEWLFTILFTIEYVLRLSCTRRPLGYACSFFGIVDLLAILPGYMTLVLPLLVSDGTPFLTEGPESLMVVRALRLLRVFRIFKLAQFLTEASTLKQALLASRAKLTVFFTAILILVVIMGAAMNLIEGATNEDFANIPKSCYWAIVTITTVGYGDIVPQTPLGRGLAAIIIVVGYSMIVVPTGIVSVELSHAKAKAITTQVCPDCSQEGHDSNAEYCKFCGGKL